MDRFSLQVNFHGKEQDLFMINQDGQWFDLKPVKIHPIGHVTRKHNPKCLVELTKDLQVIIAL